MIMWIGIAVLAVILAFTVVSGYLIAYPGVLEPIIRWPVTIPSDHGMKFEDFEVVAADGITLRGWWIPAPEQPARGTIIGLHGVASPKTDWASFSGMICPRGFNLVLYDSRGHGESDNTVVTYGYKESGDVSTVLDALGAKGYPVDSVILMGTSMGGVVALLASEDERVKAVVTQSAFTTYQDVTRFHTSSLFGAFAPVMEWPAFMWASLFEWGNEYRNVSALAAAQKLNKPILVVHGTGDWLVPPEQGRQIYDAIPSKDKTLLMVDDGVHESLWYGDYPNYQKTLYAFLDRMTEPTPNSGSRAAQGDR